MKYHQRDIVEVSFLFPDGTFKPHPAIIVSNDELQEDEEGIFYLVLITSNDWLNPWQESFYHIIVKGGRSLLFSFVINVVY